MKNFAFERVNYILMAVSMCIVILGFILMSGGESTEELYDARIFDVRRVKLAPAVTFFGFIMMIVAIMWPAKKKVADE